MTAAHPYRTLWRLPGAPVLMVFGLVARLGISMTPLGLLLLIQQATGRYAPAALAGGVYLLSSAAVAPLVGRVADRVGPARVLLVTATVHPFGLAALVLAAEHRSVPGLGAAAAFAGSTYPPLVAVLRGVWSALTEPGGTTGPLRSTALATDTSLYQLVFVAGPLLVAAITAVGSPHLVLGASAVVTVVGTVTLARGRAVRAWRPPLPAARTTGAGPLRVAGFPALLSCVAGLGVAFGAITVALPAYATRHGSDSGALAGVLFAVLSAGSAVGGFWFGAGAGVRRAPLRRQFTVLLAAVAFGYTVIGMMPNPTAMIVALFFGGAMVAPALTVENALVGQMTPAGMRNEAYTWVVTVEVAASSVTVPVAGVLVDQPGGVPWAFLVAGTAVAVAAAVSGLVDLISGGVRRPGGRGRRGARTPAPAGPGQRPATPASGRRPDPGPPPPARR